MGKAFLAAIRNSLLPAGMAVGASPIVAVPADWAVSHNLRMQWWLCALTLTCMLPAVAFAVSLYPGSDGPDF